MKRNTSILPSKHILGLDLLRFAAAAFVLVFHFGLLAPHIFNSAGASAAPQLMTIANWTHFGWIGVEIFFVLSGFVIAFSAQQSGPADFFISRFVRLVPGVWVCAPISLVILHLIDPGAWPTHLAQYLNSIAFNPFGPWIEISYWTLGLEIVFYGAVLALIASKSLRNLRSMAILLGCVASTFWVLHTTVGFGVDSPFFDAFRSFENTRISALLLVQHGMFFSIGILLWSLLIDKHASVRRTCVWLVLFIVAGCMQIAAQCDQYNEILSAHHSWTIACTVWIASLACIVLSITHGALLDGLPARVRRALSQLAWIVYPLYLINFNMTRLIFTAFAKSGRSPLDAAACAAIAALVMAWLIATLAERPLQHRMRAALRGLLNVSAKPRAAGTHTEV